MADKRAFIPRDARCNSDEYLLVIKCHKYAEFQRVKHVSPWRRRFALSTLPPSVASSFCHVTREAIGKADELALSNLGRPTQMSAANVGEIWIVRHMNCEQ